MGRNSYISALKRFGAFALVGVIFVSLFATGIMARGSAVSAASASPITTPTPEIKVSNSVERALSGFEVSEKGGSGTSSTDYVKYTHIEEQPERSSTTSSVIEIRTVEELQTMRDNLTGNYALGNDIDASATSGWNGGAGFEPIGVFTGSFDGRGYKIEDLHINRWDPSGVGLFWCVGSGGVVKNVGLENENVNGFQSVGGLVGWNAGTVANCYSTGGNVSGIQVDVGGLVGYNSGTVDNCYSTGTVSGLGYVGGLAGSSSYGTITNSYSTCSVTGEGHVGGLVGYNLTTVSNSYSMGFVSGTFSVGGLVGTSTGAVISSFWDIWTSGQSTSDGGTGKTTEQMKDIRTYTDVGWSEGLTSPWDFIGNPYDDVGNEDIWSINPAINDGYPFFTWALQKYFPHGLIDIYGNDSFTAANGVTGGSGTESDPFIIEWWDIDAAGIQIGCTTAHFVVRNCYVHEGWCAIYLYNVINGKIENVISESNSVGIQLLFSENNIIENCNVTCKNYTGDWGIQLSESSNNTISNCTVENNGTGIYLEGSGYNVLINNIASNNECGIRLGGNYNTLMGNTMSGNNYNFNILGGDLSHFIQEIDTSNTVDGKPVYYWVDQYDQQIPSDAGFVGIVNSDNITVKDLTLTKNGTGILLAYSTNSRIENIIASNNETGIYLYYSDNNVIYNNYFSNDTNQYVDGICENNRWNIDPTLSINIIGGSYFGGNYWSDYTGSDNDGDGLGDVDQNGGDPGLYGPGDYHPLVFEVFDCTPPPAPVLLSPPDYATISDNTPTFEWMSVQDISGVTYTLQIDDEDTFTSPLIYENVSMIDNACILPDEDTLPNNTYYWRVRAVDGASNVGGWSDVWQFTIDTVPPAAPNLIWPAAGGNISDNTPNLDWGVVNDSSTPVLYRCHVDNDPDFSSIDRDSGWVLDDNYQIASELVDGVYYWRVQARDNAGNFSGYSSSRSFTVDVSAPSAPSLISPENTKYENDSTPTFDWSDVAGAENYDLLVDDDPNFGLPAIQVTVVASTYTPGAALAEGNYFWKVRARDIANNTSDYSSVWTFIVDTVPPSIPVLVSPADGLDTNDNQVTFDWNDSSDANTFVLKYEVLYDSTYENTSDNTSQLGPNGFVEGSHTWKVRAWDNAGNVSGWSDQREFTIDKTAPSVPTLVSPANGLDTNDNSITFDWSDSDGGLTPILKYEVEIDGAPENTSDDTSGLAAREFAEGSHTWRVRAYDNAGNPSNWSEVWQFQISRYLPRGRIIIRGNENFTPVNGVTGGSGMESDPYIIEGWEIDASVAGGGWSGAIDVNETDNYFIIRNCYIHGGRDNNYSLWSAVKFADVWHGTIMNNRIDNVNTGIMVYDNGPEVGVPFSAFNVIDGNVIENIGYIGIEISGDPASYVMNNTVRNVEGGSGIKICGSMNVAVQSNIVDNAFGYSYGFGAYGWGGGILVNGGADNILVENNTVTNSGPHGMDIYACYNVTARYNNVENSVERGFRIKDGKDPDNVRIYLNNIRNSGMIPQGYVMEGNFSVTEKVVWDNGTHGNYWSDWTTPDVNGDGIVDNSYIFGTGNWDNHPLVNPFETYISGGERGEQKTPRLRVGMLPERYLEILLESGADISSSTTNDYVSYKIRQA